MRLGRTVRGQGAVPGLAAERPLAHHVAPRWAMPTVRMASWSPATAEARLGGRRFAETGDVVVPGRDCTEPLHLSELPR